MAISSAAVLLTACNNTEVQDTQSQTDNGTHAEINDQLQQSAEMFSGCYTVSHDEPSQIKVSLQDDGLVMQMKEPKSAGRVWDTPEALTVLPMNKASDYFSIDTKHISGLIGRPDNLFVLGYVEEAYANIDPLLDSQYLGFILQGSNTIYKVACDEVPAGEPMGAPQHQNNQSLDESRITIESAPRVDPQ